jgi:hypothetical protein
MHPISTFTNKTRTFAATEEMYTHTVVAKGNEEQCLCFQQSLLTLDLFVQ